MTDYKEPEVQVLEGEVIQLELTPDQIKMKELRSRRTTPLKVTKKNQRINVSKTLNEMGANPVEVLIHIMRGDNEALKVTKEISTHERNSAAQTLLGYVAPTIKPVEYDNPDEAIKQIPTFVPSRGIVKKDTNLLDAPSFLEDYEEDDNGTT